MTTTQRERRQAFAPNGDDWYRLTNKVGTRTARLDLFDEIGVWGTSAAAFKDEILALDVDEIELHVNSPGGEVFEAFAILNTLRDHPAKVISIVDGVAASAASFIILAGDEVVMNRNSELMIHDAFGLAVGNSADMRDLAERLDSISDNIASVYAEKAGGTTEDWRDLMRAETWYSADEAVAAGLADRVQVKKDATAAKALINFSIFNYAGREKAPAPKETPMPAENPKPPTDVVPDVTSVHVPPTAPAVVVQNHQEGAGMDPAKLREAFGLPADSSDDEVKAAIADSTFANQATDLPKDAPQDLAAAARASGAVILDKGVWEQAQAQIQEGVAASKRLREQERDGILNKAVEDGRIPPANKAYWANLYDRDPKGTADVINSLKKNLVPVSATGYSNYDEGFDPLDDFADLFPPIGKVN